MTTGIEHARSTVFTRGARRAVIAAIAAVLVTAPATAASPVHPKSSMPTFIEANGCTEHQAILDGDSGAVRASLPDSYSATVDPASGRPLVFARAERCRVAVGGHLATATLASFGVVVNSPDGLGCSSGAPALGSLFGTAPPVCNWYPLFWLASDRRTVRWLRHGSNAMPAFFAPHMIFQTGAADATGRAPFHFAARTARLRSFEMDDAGRPGVAQINVRGGYWHGGATGTKLAFSTDDITPGGATGTVHADGGSRAETLMGVTSAQYLPEYSAIAAEHWTHGSYRMQLLRTPRGAVRFSGSCSVNGVDTFQPPATNTARDLHVTYDAKGTCTGSLDGVPVSSTPVRWHSAAHSFGSCSRAQTVEPASATIDFSDGRSLTATFDFTTVATEIDMSFYGTRSGFARGHATFATPQTPPSAITNCSGAGDRKIPMSLSLTTKTPLVSVHALTPRRVRGEPHAA